MNVLVVFSIILFLLMSIIGGKKGVRSFIAIFLNFSVVILTVLFMTNPYINAIVVTIIACIIISCINLFYINKVNMTTKTAFFSTMITTLLLLSFILLVTNKAMIQGFGDEEIEELRIFSLYIGVDFIKIATAMIIMSTIGAIIDVAISISSPLREIYNRNPSISRNVLFAAGMKIGRDILGTSTNTLFFAFFGGYLGLLIWFNELPYTLGEIVNSKIVSAEMITIFCAGIGIALVIPITSLLTSYYLVKKSG